MPGRSGTSETRLKTRIKSVTAALVAKGPLVLPSESATQEVFLSAIITSTPTYLPLSVSFFSMSLHTLLRWCKAKFWLKTTAQICFAFTLKFLTYSWKQYGGFVRNLSSVVNRFIDFLIMWKSSHRFRLFTRQLEQIKHTKLFDFWRM